jgi:hypothetical protein
MMEKFFNSLPINPEFDIISMGWYNGYDLAAPRSFWNASQELRDAITGGCGPGGVGDYFVPDTIYGLDMKPACKIHDWTFVVWNNKAGFKKANNLFKNNMIRINKQNDGWKLLSKLRLKRIKKYYGAVHFFGEPSYFGSHLQYV